MHEVSLCEGVLQVIEKAAGEQKFSKVKTVWLEIGALSGVELAAMRFSFDAVMRDTLAEGAALVIIEVPADAWCMICSKSVSITQRYDSCPECGEFQLRVSGGEEMRVKELEVV